MFQTTNQYSGCPIAVFDYQWLPQGTWDYHVDIMLKSSLNHSALLRRSLDGISWRDTLPKRGTQIYWSGRWFSNNGQRNMSSENFNHKIRPSSWTIFFWIFHMFFVDFWFNLGASQLPKPQILVAGADIILSPVVDTIGVYATSGNAHKNREKWNPAKINGKLGKFLCNLFRGYYRYYRIDA